MDKIRIKLSGRIKEKNIRWNKLLEKIPLEVKRKYKMKFKGEIVTFETANGIAEIPIAEILDIKIDKFGKVFISSITQNICLQLWQGIPPSMSIYI